MSIHVVLRGMVALSVFVRAPMPQTSRAQETPAHTVALDRNGAAGTLQHAQRGVYRKAELRAADQVGVEPGFVA
jgi:hypothetical protein